MTTPAIARKGGGAVNPPMASCSQRTSHSQRSTPGADPERQTGRERTGNSSDMAEAIEDLRDAWRRAAPAAFSALAHASLILILIVATRGPLRLPTSEQPIPVEFAPAAPAPASLVPTPPPSPPPASAPASSPNPPLSGPAPDAVVAYAMQDVAVGPNLIVADGAAVHNADGWNRLRFRCRFAEAPRRIVAFEFRLGEAIPREHWSSHALTAKVPPLEPEDARNNDPP
jgi:hypothetical protein